MAIQDLLFSTLRDEPAATRELVLRLLPVIQARVRRRLGPTQQLGGLQAHDLVQEVWLLLVKDKFAQLRSWDPARGASLEGYVRMIVDREISNRRAQARAKKRGSQAQTDACVDYLIDAAPSPECFAVGLCGAQALLRHLTTSLPWIGKEVLVQLCLEHATPEEVAGSLGIDRQVVYNWRHEIRTRARKYLSVLDSRISHQRKSVELQ